MSDKVRMNWITLAIGVLWAALISATTLDNWLSQKTQAAREALPVSVWFRAGSTIINDAAPGECPAMLFDRDINRPFRADWAVTIMMQREDGGWETVRAFFGANDYRPDHVLPDALDLCWWAGAESAAELRLIPGRTYRVNTLWEIDTGDSGTRTVRRSSPPFTIE